MGFLQIEGDVLQALEHRKLIATDAWRDQGDHDLFGVDHHSNLLMYVGRRDAVVGEQHNDRVAPDDLTLDLLGEIRPRAHAC